MRSNSKRRFAYLTLLLAGYALCVVPPALATLSYFPLFKTAGGGTVLTGGAVFLLALSMRPLWQRAMRRMREGSSFLPWLVLYLLFSLLSRIADEMTVISFVGALSNLFGVLTIRLARRVGGTDEQR